MTNVPQVATAMQTLLTTTANAPARATRFTQRRSPLSGAGFAQALVFGWLSNADAILEELSQSAAACGCPVRAQALDQRFTPAAAAFLQDLLTQAVQTVVTSDPVAIPLLQRFAGIDNLPTREQRPSKSMRYSADANNRFVVAVQGLSLPSRNYLARCLALLPI